MPTETPNSTRPSSYSPENRFRSRPRQAKRRQPAPNNLAAGRVSHEISAGGIIFRRRGHSVEIFFIKDPFGRWTFPKGHQERGETLVQTALREIKEETSLDGLKYLAPLGHTTFRFRRQTGLIQKIVHLFLFEAPLEAKEKFTGEGAIFEGQWAKAQNVFTVSGYKNLDRILARALRAIAQQVHLRH
jgi:ADP-ribose pyrophosphatase YjhB (NUDIX family)